MNKQFFRKEINIIYNTGKATLLSFSFLLITHRIYITNFYYKTWRSIASWMFSRKNYSDSYVISSCLHTDDIGYHASLCFDLLLHTLVINMLPNSWNTIFDENCSSMVCTITRKEIPTLRELWNLHCWVSSFSNTSSVKTTINKIWTLRQGDRPTSAYTTDFRLLACDIPWDEVTSIDFFRYGLHNDVSKWTM
jgi:hypothetical protein